MHEQTHWPSMLGASCSPTFLTVSVYHQLDPISLQSLSSGSTQSLWPTRAIFDRQTVATLDSFYFNAEVRKRSLSVWREKITCVVQSVQEPLAIILQSFGYIWSPGVCWAHSTCFFSLNVKTGKLPQIARADYESIFTVFTVFELVFLRAFYSSNYIIIFYYLLLHPPEP